MGFLKGSPVQFLPRLAQRCRKPWSRCLPFFWDRERKHYDMRWLLELFWVLRCYWRLWRFPGRYLCCAITRVACDVKSEPTGFARDLVWFNWAFFIGVVALFVPSEWPWVRGLMAFTLVGMYVGVSHVDNSCFD